MIHLVMPFSRPENKEKLIDAYRPLGVILHLIMFEDEEEKAGNFPDFVSIYHIEGNAADCKVKMPGTYKRNCFIRTGNIRDEDYYLTVDDDDFYEANVFSEVSKMDDDIVVISMKRGYNIPEDARPPRRYPTDTLYAAPENMKIGFVSAQQLFVKGKIFKQHLHNETIHVWDGELAESHVARGEQIAYRPDLFALFNYFEPGRWEPRKRLTSIIIPVYNQQEVTIDCVKAVVENTKEPYEIIIVDNGSEPPVNELPIGKAFSIIRNETNCGFPIAVNQGIREAKGDIIILLNNDVITTPGWADNLTKHLDKYAIVGPMTNYCAGVQRTVIPVYQTEQELNQKTEEWAALHDGEAEEIKYVIGFLMVFKKELFDELGAFDDSLWPCSGEEIDFCLRARKAGYKVGVARDVYVHHFGSLTFRDLHESQGVDYMETCKRNESRLTDNWGDGWWHQEVAA